MSSKKVSSLKSVRAYLLLNGMTLKDFADEHDFNIETVKTTIKRHWGKKNSRPRGIITKEILTAISNYCEKKHP